jgi:prepilin-type N-terminal cleavage/methylation domain-containing protein
MNASDGKEPLVKTNGFTLIELAVVLAIIAILAAVLTPMVTNYLEQARVARAQADLRTIADAVKLYHRDTGRYPIFDSPDDYKNDTVSNNAASKAVFKTGTSGSANVPMDNSSGSSWALGSDLATTSLELYVNNNYSGVVVSNFPKVTFNGPYIATIDSDPWGNRYLMTAGNLSKASTKHAFVISAGPDGTLQTGRDVPATDNLVASGDDIIAIIK